MLTKFYDQRTWKKEQTNETSIKISSTCLKLMVGQFADD